MNRKYCVRIFEVLDELHIQFYLTKEMFEMQEFDWAE